MTTKNKGLRHGIMRTAIVTVSIICASISMTSASGQTASANMTIMGVARPPAGYVQFCKTEMDECQSRATKPVNVKLTPAKFQELNAVNTQVNTSIEPMTDKELYGVAELWTYPKSGKGDCEDYVLLKRYMLIQAGWPEQSLLITVVRDEKGEGHAVLTITTDQGDLVLDNQNPSIRPWQATPYAYVKRQSQNNPRMWVFVGEGDAASGVASAR